MGLSLRHSVLAQRSEVSCIPGHQASPLAGRERKLFLILKLEMAYVMRADGIHTSLPQRDGNGGRQILIEVKPHARRAMTVCIARPSAKAATLSAISASTSCGNPA